MLNESLLGEVNADEVVDDETVEAVQTVTYRFMFNFESVKKSQQVKNVFFNSAMGPALERMKSRGILVSWSFNKKLGKLGDFPNIDAYSNCLYGVDADEAFKSPFTLSVDVRIDASAENADTVILIAAYMMQAVLMCGLFTGNDIRMAFWNVDIKFVYSACYSSSGKWLFSYGYGSVTVSCEKLAGCFVRIARRLGLMEPVDEAGTRYVAYSYGESNTDQFMFVIDSDGKCLANYEVELVDGDAENGKYLENALMHVKFSSGRENYLKMDGMKLSPDDFFDCSETFSEGYASVTRLNHAANSESNLIDKDGNLLLKDWYENVKNFSDGLAIITKRMPDSNDKNNKNFIDRSGKPVLLEWYKDIDFEDDVNTGRRTVARVIHRSADGLCKYNYVNRKGKQLLGRWITGDCGVMMNGFAKVCEFENNRFRYNFMREDGSFVSEKWFAAVCGWPECGLFAFVNPGGGWQFRETDSGKVLFGGAVFRKVNHNAMDDGFKYYDVEVEDVDSGKRYNNLISADGVMCCDKTDSYDVSYVGNGFATVQKEFIGETVLWKWGTGPVKLDRKISGASMWGDSEYMLVASKDYKHNIVGKDGKQVSDEWFDGIGYCKDGFAVCWTGKGESKVANVVVCKTGKTLFGPEGLCVNKIYVAVPDMLVVVESWFSNTLKYNIFDCDGNRLLDKWTEFRIMPLDNGLMRVGPASYVDNSGKVATLI